MTNNNINNFIGFEGSISDSKIVLFGVPFDGTTSYRPGTRFGPFAIRAESYSIETYSPYLDMDLEEFSLYDAGDIEIPFGNTELVLELIEKYTKKLLNNNKKTIMLGGEHLISYPSIKSYINYYKKLHIIHLDAHTDLREEYLGESNSHATVIRKVYDYLQDKGSIWQFGIRSGTKEEFEWAKTHIHMQKFNLKGIEKAIEYIGNEPVYITIDLDVLDPSIFPGTGTPEPGGVTFKELMDFFKQLTKLNIVGADIVELSPHYDQSGVSTSVACKVLRELTLVMNVF